MHSIERRSMTDGSGGSRRVLLLGLLVVAAMATVPRVTLAAQSTCNAQLGIDYVSGPNFPNPGDIVRVRLTIGTASIQNGTTFTLSRIRFDLDCANPPPPGSVPCADDGLVIGYQGDSTITTTCAGVTFSTGHAIGGTPNEVVFSANNPIAIPANTPAFCQLEFDVQVLGPSNDSTPTLAEEVAGYNASSSDGQCNNGLSSSGAQSGAITLCPACNDNNPCTTDSCNSATGECQHVDQCTTTTTSTTTTTTSTTTTSTTTTTTSTTTTFTTTTSTTTTSTTSTAPPTTTTTLPVVTRTLGFWKNHPTVIDGSFDGPGGVPSLLPLQFCGQTITMPCAAVAFLSQRGGALNAFQRQGMAALLNCSEFGCPPNILQVIQAGSSACATGSATFDFGAAASTLDSFNGSGDNLNLPFQPPSAQPKFCTGPAHAAQAEPRLGPSGDSCEAARCSTQAAIDAACPCATATNHGRHVSCVAHVVKQLSKNGTVPTNCRGKIMRCAAKSTCGKALMVTCTPTCNIAPTGAGTCVNDPTVPCTSNGDCGVCHTRSAGTCPPGTTEGSGTCCAACASPSGTSVH
jgi:hypothetical protein